MAAARPLALSVIIEAIDKVTAPLKRIGAAFGAANAKVKAFGDATGVPVLANAIGKVGGALGGVVKRAGQVVGVVAGMASAGFAAATALGVAFAETTGAIGDMASVTGASRERLQELGFAAQMSGSSMEALGGALQKMNVTVSAAASGNKELKEMFAGLQISLKNTNGTLKSTDELFDLFVNRISRIKNPALQSKAALKIFGEGATQLLPLLRGGNKGIAEMAAEARALGVVLSNDAVESGEEFGDVLDKLSMAAKGAMNTIAAALIPTLNKLGTSLVDTFIKYRPQIEAFAATFAERLPGYLEKAGGAFTQLVAAAGPMLETLGDLASFAQKVFDTFGVGPTILTAVGTIIAGTLLPPVIALTTAVWGLGAALLATPVGWFIAAIAGIAAAVYLIYDNWADFSSFFTDKFDAVKAAFKDNFVLGLVQVWKEFNPVSLIMDSLNGLIKFATGIDVGAIISGKSATGGGAAPVGNPNYTAVPEGGRIAAGLADAKAKVTIDFKNLPTGAEVDSSGGQGVKVQTNQGYSMMAVR